MVIDLGQKMNSILPLFSVVNLNGSCDIDDLELDAYKIFTPLQST